MWPRALMVSSVAAAFLGLVPVQLAAAVSAVGEQSLESVSQRMRYWREAGPRIEDTGKYLLLEQDGAGVNNKRIGWEMAGVVALHVGRTLVLPPNEVWWMIDVNGTTSKTEEFINLDQLRGGLPVLTFQEFARKEKGALSLPEYTVNAELSGPERGQWKDFALSTFKQPGKTHAEWCDLNSYRSDEAVVYINHYPEGRMLDCEEWHKLGEPQLTEAQQEWKVPNSAYSLLRNHFVWHKDVFELAAPVVRELGLFNYVALHARFNDFKEFDPAAVQSAQGILSKWGEPGDVALVQTSGRIVRRTLPMSTLELDSRASAHTTLRSAARSRSRAHYVLKHVMHWVQPGTVMYISTDETDENFLRTFKERGIDARWSHDFFDKADSPIAQLVAKDPVRANKLRGCVEQVICAFGKIFLGTSKSTFSGYITRMRIYADAPQRGLQASTRLFHTDAPTAETTEAVQKEIQEWEARGGLSAVDKTSPGVF